MNSRIRMCSLFASRTFPLMQTLDAPNESRVVVTRLGWVALNTYALIMSSSVPRQIAFLWLLCYASLLGAEPRPDANPIPASAFDSDIIVVGERHQEPRSHALVESMIQHALSEDRCVAFALEIAGSAQRQWRRAGGEFDVIASIHISPTHDSQSLRALMTRLSEWSQDECLTLHAIDDPKDGSIDVRDRDLYMAQRLDKIAADDVLVIALVGNLHAVRQLPWDDTVINPKPPMTSRLEQGGALPFVVLQDWVDRPERRVYRRDSPAARRAIDHLLSAASVYPAYRFLRYADLLIQWPKDAPE